MSLKSTIDAEIKAAMLAKQSDKLLALRDVKKMILEEETKPGRATSELSSEEETRIVQKAVKQRKDSVEIFEKQNRADLADKEKVQIEVIEAFLPKQMSEVELRAALLEIKARVGASAPSDMGKMMGVATKELAGKAEGRAISAMVKEILA
jgi:uncharacterized protein